MSKGSKVVRLGGLFSMALAVTLFGDHLLAQSQGTALEKRFIDPAGGFTQVVTVKDRGVKTIYVSGQVGRGEDLAAHVESAFQGVVRRLESAGASAQDVVKIRIYVKDFKPEEYPAIREARHRTFDREHWPTSTMIGVQSLFADEFRVEIEAVAVVEDPDAAGTVLEKQYIGPSNGFSQVVVVKSGGVKTIYIAGHVGRGDDMAAQSVSVLLTLAQRLESAGASLKDLVKTNIYIADYTPADRATFSEARTKALGAENLPVSTLIGVQSLVNDRFKIEIDAVAVVEDDGAASRGTVLDKAFIDPARGFTQVVTAKSGGAKTIYVAGQVGRSSEDLETQADQAYANLKRRLEAAGATPADLVKVNFYMANYTPGDGRVLGAARRTHGFPDQDLPAATLIGIPSLYSEAALIEIEGIAVVQD